LSYTRARGMNYHAMEAASTAKRPIGLQTFRVPPAAFAPGEPLNRHRFPAYTELSINNERR